MKGVDIEMSFNIDHLTTNAETTSWLTENLSENDLIKLRQLALISAKIELKRKELGFNQKEFAAFMGVSQGMVSKWESGEYNFTISTLQDICFKLGLEFTPEICDKKYIPDNDYKFIHLSSNKRKFSNKYKKSILNEDLGRKIIGIA